MPRPQYPLALVSTALLIAAASGSTIPALAAPGIAFGVPVVVDPIHTNGEPDIGIDPQGRVFVSGPTGTGTQRSTWFGSVDQGHTFRVISPGPPPSPLAGLIDPPGGGDTDINFDRSGKQYFADLYALTCLRTATTSDGGAPGSPNGYPAIDQQTGKVFQAAGNPNGDGTYDLLLNIGTPDVNGNLTFLDAPPTVTTGWSPANLIHIADNLSGSPDTLFSVLSMDSARN